MDDPGYRTWWKAKPKEAWRSVIPYVQNVESVQAPLFIKLARLGAFYDTNPRTNREVANAEMDRGLRGRAIVTENLIATNIDTVAANVADTDVRVRIQTDGADWNHQQAAKRLEMYANGLSKKFEVGDKLRRAFKMGAALKGTGVLKVWVDKFNQIRVANVRIDNIIVDDLECANADPRQLSYRDFFDKGELSAQFPEYSEQINKSQTASSWNRRWAGYRPFQPNELVVIESWRLPIGPKGHPEHVPGRHVLCIDGCDLLDEEYDDEEYPFIFLRWNAPEYGFYGIGAGERLVPHQNLLNRRNYQINRSLDKKADPTVWVHQGDQNIAVRTQNEFGTIGVFKVQPPVVIDQQAVGKETYDSRITIKQDAAHEIGVDQLMQTGSVPGGIESGVGVREVRTTRTQRFSIQEKMFESAWLRVVWRILVCCKQLGGTKAPEILKVSKYGYLRIKWSEIDLEDVRIEMMAASTISDTPAGRRQQIIEFAQAGVITLDESRELFDHPDIESKLTLYNSTAEAAEMAIYLIESGEYLVPAPWMNLDATIRMMQKELNRIAIPEKYGGAPEEIIEALSDYISIAASIINPPPPPQAAGPGLPAPVPPGAPIPGGPMPPPGLSPGAGPPVQTAASAPAFAPGTYAPMGAG